MRYAVARCRPFCSLRNGFNIRRFGICASLLVACVAVNDAPFHFPFRLGSIFLLFLVPQPQPVNTGAPLEALLGLTLKSFGSRSAVFHNESRLGLAFGNDTYVMYSVAKIRTLTVLCKEKTVSAGVQKVGLAADTLGSGRSVSETCSSCAAPVCTSCRISADHRHYCLVHRSCVCRVRLACSECICMPPHF